MILYNTLMGWSAAIIILTFAGTLRQLAKAKANAAEEEILVVGAPTGIVLLVSGLILTPLSLHMALTWPLKVNPPINTVFAEPCLILGVLALVGGIITLIATGRAGGLEVDPEDPTVLGWMIGAVGLILVACALAIFRFDLVGDAPPIEPITGQFKGWENTTFGLIYLLAGISAILVPFKQYAAAAWGFFVTGGFFLLFSALNYYTHTGMGVCTNGGPCLPF